MHLRTTILPMVRFLLNLCFWQLSDYSPVYIQRSVCMAPWSPHSYCGTVTISRVVIMVRPGVLWAFCCIV